MSNPATSSSLPVEILEERGITSECDREIRQLLCAVFADPADQSTFSQSRAWHGSAPAWTVLGRRDGRLVAHIGLVCRRIRAGALPIDIFGVQNFAVHKDVRGSAYGPQLLQTAAAEARRRGLRWGLLFCVPELERYYARSGWRRIAVQAIMIGPESGRDEPIPGKNIAMVLELGPEPFPAGDLHLQGADW